MSEDNLSNDNLLDFDFTWDDCVHRFISLKARAQEALNLLPSDSELVAHRQCWIDICQGQLDLVALLRHDAEFADLG